MELQNFIDTSPDYVNILKSTNFIVKRFSKYGLYLLKYPYEKEINIDSYERYCRGALIDMNTNKVVFIPPSKASQCTLLENEVDSIQELYDGTMINMTYRNNEWILSTRSDIGLNNKWDSKSFKQMFEECGPIDYNVLNKEYTYSFVMQHVHNRNISIINENKLILVEVRHNLNIIDMSVVKNNLVANSLGFIIAESLTSEKIEEYMNILNNNTINSFNWKGLTYKKDNNRFNIINPMFENVKELLINTYWQSKTILLIKRANKYFPIIEEILKTNKIPDDFKYLAVAESGLENVTSPSGAKGFWQILKKTGKELNLQIDSDSCLISTPYVFFYFF